MNAKMWTLKSILLTALLALALTACGAQSKSFDISSAQAAAEPGAKPVDLPDTGKPVAMVQILTRIYSSPNSGEVVDVRTPSQTPIELVGRSEDSAWLATGDVDNPGKVNGWVQAGEVATAIDIESLPVLKSSANPAKALAAPAAVLLTRVYFSPNADSQVVGVLTPYAKIAPYARTSDGKWLAVSGSNNSPSGWVQAGDVKLPAEIDGLPVIYGP